MSAQGTTTQEQTEVLVDTDWVAKHLNDTGLRLVEVDVDTTAYDQGHVPGAIGFNWQTQLQARPQRDLLPADQFGVLLGEHGIGPDSTVVAYGDNNNWFAAWFVWNLKYYGHRDARLMDGGRKKWLAEGRPTTTESPRVQPVTYRVGKSDPSIRALREEVAQAQARQGAGVALVDVRSPKEFSGELLAPENLPQEGAQRGGHIPGAVNIPWGQAVAENGTFKPRQELEALYLGQGVTRDKEVIAYCRIGERSSHTWFVLKYLLGYPRVRNYDGSWTEWGSLIGAPIAR
jgi:thiosulfate/3-mercaptopyruvate sulfurtransferase